MIVYSSVACISMIFAYLYQKKRNNAKKSELVLYAFLSFLPVFLVSALRDISVGSDTSGTYYNIYNLTLKGENIRDVLYLVINKIAIFIHRDYRSVLIITSALIYGLLYYALYRQSKFVVESVLLLFITNVFFINMNMIRQGMATAVFLAAIPFILEKKLIKYLICILIAGNIHSSGYLYIVVYFLTYVKINKKIVIVSVIITIIYSAFISDVIENILISNTYLRQYFSWYLTSGYNSGSTNTISLSINSLILIMTLYICKGDKIEADVNMYIWCELLSLLCLILSSKIPLAQRLSWMFNFSRYIYMPKVIAKVKNPTNRILLKSAVYISFFVYMAVTIFVMHYHEVYPYKIGI